MNKFKIFYKTLSQIHNYRQNHGLSLGFLVNKLGNVVLYAVLELHTVHVSSVVRQIVRHGIGGNLAHLVHKVLSLTHIDEAAGDNVGL